MSLTLNILLFLNDNSSTIDETEVSNNAFELLFAFDEIVALGYRESVNLNQIRVFTEMDSHEEKVAIAMRKSQEEAAKKQRKEQMAEIAKRKREAGKGGRFGGMSMAVSTRAWSLFSWFLSVGKG